MRFVKPDPVSTTFETVMLDRFVIVITGEREQLLSKIVTTTRVANVNDAGKNLFEIPNVIFESEAQFRGAATVNN